MKPSDEIYKIYDRRLEQQKKGGYFAISSPGSNENLLSAILEYLDEQAANLESKHDKG